ncbi:hypothetical protein HYH02_006140 [Chlamydomonas schloesseri]|uniref:Serine-threonine/tyrosine-protein kinase catalytic domain-containing protein n=1 Tax=Chlamydomonas schloesseri TaxID=2026947 RepID=A0A835WK70_9CHLO|nr:hypothetical protein HYH02_006140 [Chlamydomonas schloesseri]|eukprot:KAG2448788.1 hypothetical protein HYH02_006140 [Chlamydomonas schloesseri]
MPGFGLPAAAQGLAAAAAAIQGLAAAVAAGQGLAATAAAAQGLLLAAARLAMTTASRPPPVTTPSKSRFFSMEGALFELADIPAGAHQSSQNSSASTVGLLRPVTIAAANTDGCDALQEHLAGNREVTKPMAAALPAAAPPAAAMVAAAVMTTRTGIQFQRPARTADVTAAALVPIADAGGDDVGLRTDEVRGSRAVLNTADLTVDLERSAALLQLQPATAGAGAGAGAGSGRDRGVGTGGGTVTPVGAVEARAEELARPLPPSSQVQLQPPAPLPQQQQQQSLRCQSHPCRLVAATAASAVDGGMAPSSAAAATLQRDRAAPEPVATTGPTRPAAAPSPKGNGASGTAIDDATLTAGDQMGVPQYYLGSGNGGTLGTAGEAVGGLLNLAQVRGIVTDLRVLHIRPGAALLLGRAASTDVTVVARFERGLPEQLLSLQLLRVAAAAHAEGHTLPRHPNVATLERVAVVALPAHVLDATPHAPPAAAPQPPPSSQPAAATASLAPAPGAHLPAALRIGGMSPVPAAMTAFAGNSPAAAAEAPAGPVHLPTAISAAHFHTVAAAAQASNSGGGGGATSSNAGHAVLSQSSVWAKSITIQPLGDSCTGFYHMPAGATGATAAAAVDALTATAASIALCADDALLDPDALVATRALQQAEVVRGAPAGVLQSRSLARSRMGSLLSFASFAAAAASAHGSTADGAASGAPFGANASAIGGILNDATGVLTSCSHHQSGEAAAGAAAATGVGAAPEDAGGAQQQGGAEHRSRDAGGGRLLDVLRGPTVRLPQVVGALRSGGGINDSSNAPVHIAASAATLLSLPMALPAPPQPTSPGTQPQSYPHQSQSRLHATFSRSSASAAAATAMPPGAPTPRASASAPQLPLDIGFVTLTLTELCDGDTLQEEAKRGAYKCVVTGVLDAWPREAVGVHRGAAGAGLWGGGERGSGVGRYKALLDPGKVFSDAQLVARLDKFLLTAMDVARGLQHLHEVLGVPHGDLASRNVLLHRCMPAVDRRARQQKPRHQQASAGAPACGRDSAAAAAAPAEPCCCLTDARGYLAKLVGYGRLTAAAAAAAPAAPEAAPAAGGGTLHLLPMLSGGSAPTQMSCYCGLQKSPSGVVVVADSVGAVGAAGADSSAGWLALPAAASPMGRGGSMRPRTVSLAAAVAASAAAAGAAAGALDTGLVSGGMSGSPGGGALAAYAGSSAPCGFGGGVGWSASGRAVPSGLQLPGASCSSVLGTAAAAAAGSSQPHYSSSCAVLPHHSATSIMRLQQVQVGLWRDVHCLAPERLTDPTSPPSTEADVYALGAIMYEMVYGEAPWAGLTAACVAVGAATGDMRITCTQPLALACVADLIERCTAPAPEARPSLAEVRAALAAASQEAAAGRELVAAQRQEREARRLQAMLLGSSSSEGSGGDETDDGDDIMGI